MRSWIGAHLQAYQSQEPDRTLRILSFGDGLGIDAYYLAMLGYEVTYFDPSESCTYFAKKIFTRGKLQIEMLSDPKNLEDQFFDAIVCLDVLEHVQDPSLLVGWLCKYLKLRGRFIVHAPFFYLDPSVSTHLRSNLCFSGDTKRLYAPHGLAPIAAEFFWNPLVLELQTDLPLRSRLSWLAKVGGALLSVGRTWPWPHMMMSRQIARDDALPKRVEGLETGN
ncbi:MAG: methyltransferase domain-containing protein [Planctomycetes bacterium]|nr:methyltransferase domain-containing protein [Planctomycetota bacterium]